jgi:hypothetical protein
MHISKRELVDWINEFNNDEVLMLTISEPHAKLHNLTIDGIYLEPVIDAIIKLVNRFVFGKNKKFEALNGIVIEENFLLRPHYHILLYKPVNMNFENFKHKLEQISARLCEENFQLDLRDSNLSQYIQKSLSKPCYDKFARVTEVHGNIGSYLTKKTVSSKYYILQGRKFNRANDCLDLKINPDNYNYSSNYGYV